MEFLEDKMERSSNQMDARLDKIIDLLLLNQGSGIGPSPFRKKTRHQQNINLDMDIDHFDQMSSTIDHNQPEIQPESPKRVVTNTPPQPDLPMEDHHQGDTGHMHQQADLPPLPDSPIQEDHTWLKRNMIMKSI